MPDITLTITQAGLDALVDAQGGETDAIRVVEVGLSENVVTVSPTITALPGEFKRLDTFAGQSVSETVIHMTAQDPSTDIYDLRAIGLYLEDGTLFAVYGQETPIFSKVAIASFLFAFDVAFEHDVSADITFGDANFLWPPASETVKGVAEIATQAEVDAGADDLRIVTPLKLAGVLDPLAQALEQADADLAGDIATLAARTITGGGLVTGGGDLTANRVLTVPKASGAEVLARTNDAKAVTPSGLASLLAGAVSGGVLTLNLGEWIVQIGTGARAANSVSNVTFPTPYTTECFFFASGSSTDTATEGSCCNSGNTLTTGSVTNSANTASSFTWLAIGK